MSPSLNEQFLAVAQSFLKQGWYVFGCPYETKVGHRGSHGSLDARNDEHALNYWIPETRCINGLTGKMYPRSFYDKSRPSNPAVRCDKSGLTVLDADYGLATLDEVITWMTKNNLSTGYIVKTGRSSGGWHLYYRGVRTLPEAKFEIDGVRGDIRCKGLVILPGGLHDKTGRFYEVALGTPNDISLLPDTIRDYRNPEKVKQAEEANRKAAARALREQDTTCRLIPENKRHDWLVSKASLLKRHYDFDEDTLFTCLKNLFQHCEVGNREIPDEELRSIAAFYTGKISARSSLRELFNDGTRHDLRRRLTERTSIIALLQTPELFPLGERLSIQTIMVRIVNDFPSVPLSTLRRHLHAAGWKTDGRLADFGKTVMWVRHGKKL